MFNFILMSEWGGNQGCWTLLWSSWLWKSGSHK